MPENIATINQELKPGKYQVVTLNTKIVLLDRTLMFQAVAWDLDTTGRRLIDEICQIG